MPSPSHTHDQSACHKNITIHDLACHVKRHSGYNQTVHGDHTLAKLFIEETLGYVDKVDALGFIDERGSSLSFMKRHDGISVHDISDIAREMGRRKGSHQLLVRKTDAHNKTTWYTVSHIEAISEQEDVDGRMVGDIICRAQPYRG